MDGDTQGKDTWKDEGKKGGHRESDDAVTKQPRSGEESYSYVGLEQLAETDRLIVEQLTEYSEANCPCANYEGENQFEVTDRFGQRIFLADEESCCCFRQCCESLRGFDMNLTDRQGNAAISIKRPLRCDNCCLCPCFTQKLTVECPSGNLAGTVDQSISFFTPTYNIKDKHGEKKYVIQGPFQLSLCSCIETWCKCFKRRDIIFRIMDKTTWKQVGSISKEWNSVLKDVHTKADRFSIDFPPGSDVEIKATMLAATFLIDYLYFEADPNDHIEEEA